MIKVLIIEDNIEKLKKIISFLNTVCNLQKDAIDATNSINSGREALIAHRYDLLLLDLVLPVNEHEEPSPENGTRFLDEIHYNPSINIPIHIIGLTEFDKVFRDFYEKFEDKLWGLINFNISNSDWMDKLKSKIFYLQTFKSRYETFIANTNKYDVAIVTALNEEFKQLLSIGNWTKMETEDDQIIYYETTINTKANNNLKVVSSCINQMGMQASAAVGAKIIGRFSPKYVFINGICAGLSQAGAKLGDIIIATQCWDYESGKITESENGDLLFKPDMKLITTDQGVISRLTSFSNEKNALSKIYNDFGGHKPDNQLNVHFGSVGTGPYVLSSKGYLKKLIETERKLLGIDMEGFGIYKAAQYFRDTHPVFIKSVSDYGDETKADNFHEYAAYTSASFTLKFLYEFY